MNSKNFKLYANYIPEGSVCVITLYKTKAGAKKALERGKKWDRALIVNGRDNKGRFNGTWAVIYYNVLCLSSKV